MSVLIDNIVELRKRANLTQQQIAEYLGVSQTDVSRIESGERKITASQIAKLADLFGVNIKELNCSKDLSPMNIAFRANQISSEDLKTIALIEKIAINSVFMEELHTDDR